MRIEYHRTLIADRVRNEAFYAALKAVIVPGKTVVADIGAGTGLLGLMASKLGAKSVYLFETAAVASVAEKILKANRVKNCHLIPCHSTEFTDQFGPRKLKRYKPYMVCGPAEASLCGSVMKSS